LRLHRRTALIGATAHWLLPATATAQIEPYATGLIPIGAAQFRSFPRAPTTKRYLPAQVDLSARLPPIGFQGVQGSCAAWSAGYYCRGYYVRHHRRDANFSWSADHLPSPAFLFNSIKKDDSNCEGGATIVAVLNLLRQGSLSLQQMPYNELECERPNRAAQSLATRFQISNFFIVEPSSVDDVRDQLAAEDPVIVALRVDAEIHKLKRAAIYNHKVALDQTPSFHGITLCGYDHDRRVFKFVNSWGRRWGSDGFGWISYESLISDAVEAYVLRVPLS